jgi:DNA-binding transcriptional MerR regulator
MARPAPRRQGSGRRSAADSPGAARPREFSIGALARRARIATSVLRYYEKEGLLKPVRRTAAGYRLYGAEAEQTLLFINRAKRLGFSLEDIRQFLAAGESDTRATRRGGVAGIAEARFVEIERRLTELLVLRHELEAFLREMSDQLPEADGARRLYHHLVEHVCGHHGSARDEAASLRSLMNRMGCGLGSWDRREVLDGLRGHHIHLWREPDGYTVLIPEQDARIGTALQQIAAFEAGCAAHAEPEVELTGEGWLFTARGENAFLFAQFFLALEQAEA